MNKSLHTFILAFTTVHPNLMLHLTGSGLLPEVYSGAHIFFVSPIPCVHSCTASFHHQVSLSAFHFTIWKHLLTTQNLSELLLENHMAHFGFHLLSLSSSSYSLPAIPHSFSLWCLALLLQTLHSLIFLSCLHVGMTKSKVIKNSALALVS